MSPDDARSRAIVARKLAALREYPAAHITLRASDPDTIAPVRPRAVCAWLCAAPGGLLAESHSGTVATATAGRESE